jgi:hypothetical protein
VCILRSTLKFQALNSENCYSLCYSVALFCVLALFHYAIGKGLLVVIIVAVVVVVIVLVVVGVAVAVVASVLI